jgi:hypothetical protein
MSKLGMSGKSKTVKNLNKSVVKKNNPAFLLRALSAAGTGLNMSKNKKPMANTLPKRTPSKKHTRRRR